MVESELNVLLNTEMKRRNLSLRDTAKLVGISHPVIANILAGETPSFETCIKIAPFLHMQEIQVMRIAKLIKPISSLTEEKEELLYLFDQLPDQEKRSLLRFIRATLDAIKREN